MSLSVSLVEQSVRAWQWVLLACVIFVAAYYGLWMYPLLDNNEGLYAQVAREMVLQGKWVIPHLNGVPYIEKPPLLYWLIALSYKIFGVYAWSARLIPSTAFALEIALITWSVGKLAGRQMGWIAGMVLGTMWGMAILSRMVFFDGLLATFFASALLMTFLFWQTAWRPYLLGAAASLAAAVLTKGLLAVALYGAIVTFWCATEHGPWQARLYYWLRLWDPWAIFLFLALTLPWHIAASLQEPGFAWFYFVNEHILRFLDLRLPRDYYQGPWYFYLPRVLGYIFPWTFCLVTLWPWQKNPGIFSENLRRFFWIWFLSTLVFFSISQAKANYYMILGIPPLACLLAEGLVRFSARKWAVLLTILPLCTFFLVAAYCSVVQKDIPLGLPSLTFQFSPFFMVYPLPIALYIAWCFLKRYDPRWILLFQGSTLIFCFISFFFLVPLLNGNYSQFKKIAHTDGQPVTLYRDYEALSSALFYSAAPIQIYKSVSHDLAWGQAARPGATQFLENIEPTTRPPFFLVRRGRASEFKEEFPEYKWSWSGPNSLLYHAPHITPPQEATAPLNTGPEAPFMHKLY